MPNITPTNVHGLPTAISRDARLVIDTTSFTGTLFSVPNFAFWVVEECIATLLAIMAVGSEVFSAEAASPNVVFSWITNGQVTVGDHQIEWIRHGLHRHLNLHM